VFIVKSKMNWLDWTAMVFIIIGGLNWGLVGLFQYDLIAEIFGVLSATSRVLYTIVGAAALYTAIAVPMKMGMVAPSPGHPTPTPSR
jgi:uncharacterized membrane protein YuzA (DUF378 family)